MKVYHYTQPSNWQGVKNGNYKNNYTPGLAADKRLGILYPPAREIGALFALLEPKPSNWADNPYFKTVWRELKEKTGDLLLEIDTLPNDPNVFIVEGGHIVANWNRDKRNPNIPPHLLHEKEIDKEKAYFESRIPLDEYIKREKDLHYVLPEVVMTKHIPINRIKIAEKQPLLFEAQQTPHIERRRQLLIILDETQELNGWRKRHQTEINELKKSAGFKPKGEGNGFLF